MNILPEKVSHEEKREHSSRSGITCACICTGETPLARASTGCFKEVTRMLKGFLMVTGMVLLTAVLTSLWILGWSYLAILCWHGLNIFTYGSTRDAILLFLSALGLVISCIFTIGIYLSIFLTIVTRS